MSDHMIWKTPPKTSIPTRSRTIFSGARLTNVVGIFSLSEFETGTGDSPSALFSKIRLRVDKVTKHEAMLGIQTFRFLSSLTLVGQEFFLLDHDALPAQA